MDRRFWSLGLAALVFSTLGAWAPRAAGAFVPSLTVSITPQAGGLNLYEYTITHDSANALPVAQFDLAVANDADVTDVIAPSGWGVDAPWGEGYVSFFVEVDGAELAPGSIGVFSFLSHLLPREFDYFIIGSDPPDFDVLEGRVQAPGAAIPEPSGLALAGLGLVGVIGLFRFRR